MTSGSVADCSAVRTRGECTSQRSQRRSRLCPVVPRVSCPTGAARPGTSESLVVLGDPVSGERLLGVEELLDVMKDQIFEGPTDEGDEHLADAGES